MSVEHLEATPVIARAALGELLRAHAPVLLAAARAMTLDDAEAQDLVQTTFEIAVRRIDHLREPAAIRSWLLTIQAREAFRVTRRLRNLVRLDRTVHEIPVGRGPDETERIAVNEALRALTPRVRAAVVLHHMAALSVAETAVALSVSENTVKSQLKTGLGRLRELLHDG